jgi:hypothetical protein
MMETDRDREALSGSTRPGPYSAGQTQSHGPKRKHLGNSVPQLVRRRRRLEKPLTSMKALATSAASGMNVYLCCCCGPLLLLWAAPAAAAAVIAAAANAATAAYKQNPLPSNHTPTKAGCSSATQRLQHLSPGRGEARDGGRRAAGRLRGRSARQGPGIGWVCPMCRGSAGRHLLAAAAGGPAGVCPAVRVCATLFHIPATTGELPAVESTERRWPRALLPLVFAAAAFAAAPAAAAAPASIALISLTLLPAADAVAATATTLIGALARPLPAAAAPPAPAAAPAAAGTATAKGTLPAALALPLAG